MAMQRFVGKDMKSALILVKEKIGDEALILGDRAIPGGVEVLVGIPKVEKSTPRNQVKNDILKQYKGLDKIPVNGSIEDSEPKNMQMESTISSYEKKSQPSKETIESDDVVSKREINMLRKDFKMFASTMTEQLKGLAKNDASLSHPIHEKIFKRMERKGFSTNVIGSLLRDVDSSASAQQVWKHCIVSLSRRLKTVSMDPLRNVHIFLGPTGAGKTTTIAKLATKAVMKYGPDSVALLSTDRFRMGAVDQLRALSMALGTSVGIVDEKRPLEYWIKMFAKKRLMLVDTAGFHPGSKQWSNHIKRLEPYLNSPYERPVHGHLVLPVTGQREFIEHSIHSYDRLSLCSAVLTKTDEAVLMGPTLSCLLLKNIPVSWFCDGQAVPKNIHNAKSYVLVSKALSQEPVWSQDNARWPDLHATVQTGHAVESTE